MGESACGIWGMAADLSRNPAEPEVVLQFLARFLGSAAAATAASVAPEEMAVLRKEAAAHLKLLAAVKKEFDRLR